MHDVCVWCLSIWQARIRLTDGAKENIADPGLRGQVSADTVGAAVQLALRCCVENPEQRPNMTQVVQILESLPPASALSADEGRPDAKGKRVLVEEEEEEEEEEGQMSLVRKRRTGQSGRGSRLPPALKGEGETSRSGASQNRSIDLLLRKGESVGKQTSIVGSVNRNTSNQGQADSGGGPLQQQRETGGEGGRGQPDQEEEEDEAAGGETSSSDQIGGEEGRGRQPNQVEDEAAGGDTSSSEREEGKGQPDQAEEYEAGGGGTSSTTSSEQTVGEEEEEEEGSESGSSRIRTRLQRSLSY